MVTDAPTDRTVWGRIRQGLEPSTAGIDEVAREHQGRLGSQGVAGLREDLRREVLGLGPLEDLVADESVTDVLVNGSAAVWVDRGTGLHRAATVLRDEEAVRRLAVRLASLAGQRLDDASPCVDGLLPGGIRLHAVLPPMVEGGPHLSLRIPRRQAPDLSTLSRWGMFDGSAADLLRQVVRSRLAFVVTGGTGTGKTTVLGAMLAEVSPAERLVVVEDVRELRVEHNHVVRLQGRMSNVEGRGGITLTTLVRQSLRMRPDRLVVGEVRGAEVREMLGAMNTGHEGGCGTLHANSSADVVSRFEALGALAGLGPDAVHAQLASAVDVVIHLGRRSGHRCLREVAVLGRADRGVVAEPAVRIEGDGPQGGRLVRGQAWPVLERMLAGHGRVAGSAP